MHRVVTPVNADGRAKLGIRSGDTVRVIQNIIEIKKGRGTDKKEKTIKNIRKQVFEGLVLSVKHRTEPGASFTVRTTLSGVGVEKTFPLYSPVIDSIEIVKRSNVRRAKLYFIREKATKEVRRQLRDARMMGIKSDETVIATESIAVAGEEMPEETTVPTKVTAEEKKEVIA